MDETAGPAPGFRQDRKKTILFEPTARRVRMGVGDSVVADSLRAHLLLESGHLPVYYLPREDVRLDLLVPSARTSECPFKGRATYWTIAADGVERTDAVWSYETPYDESAALAGWLGFDWRTVDRCWEEDEEVIGHPRDPYHRVDLRVSRRRVRVVLGGETVAESRRALFLFETGMPTRYYLPADDVRLDLLTPTTTTSVCPYKGRASYWSAAVGGRRFDDVVWSYLDPLPDQPRIKGLLAFYDEKVDAVLVDPPEV